jgi:hypothetical protein
MFAFSKRQTLTRYEQASTNIQKQSKFPYFVDSTKCPKLKIVTKSKIYRGFVAPSGRSEQKDSMK